MSSNWGQPARAPSRSSGRSLVRVGAIMLIVMLYALGGISLYLRANLLRPATATPVAQMMASATPEPTWTLAPTATAPVPTEQPQPTATLYPTLTPRP